MCLAQGPQHSDTGEAQTQGPSVSSQALDLPLSPPPPQVSLKDIPELWYSHSARPLIMKIS